MLKRFYSVVLALCFILLLSSPVFAQRQYVGDEPPDKYVVGRQASLRDMLESQLSIFPGVFPDDEEMRNQLIWIRYPLNNYYFRTAPSIDKGFLDNKMEDAGTTVVDTLANGFFLITKNAALLGNNMILICFDNHIGDGMISFVSQLVKSVTDFQEGSLFSLMFILVVCVLGVGIVLYLVKAQLMKAFASVLVSVICIACILGYAANIDAFIPSIMKFINNTTGVALMTTSHMKDAPREDAGAPEVGSTVGETTLLQQGLIESTNAMWHVFVGAPWANGMFGHSDPNKLKLLPQEVEAMNNDLNQVVRIRFGLPPVEINWGNLMGNPQTLEGDVYMDSVWLACSNEMKMYMLRAITGTQERYQSGNTAVTYTAGQGISSANYHLSVAFLSVLPALVFVIFTLVVGIPVLIAQFLLMFALIILPFALLLGVSGDKGIVITMMYLKKLLGLIATKVIYGFYLSFILLFAFSLTRIPLTEQNTAITSLLIAIIFVFGIKFRKRFFEGVMGLISAAPGKDQGNTVQGLLSKVGYAAAGYIAQKKFGGKETATVAAGNEPAPPGGHNPDFKEHVEYYDNGQVKSKQYTQNGQYHNENGAAYIEYYENGQMKSQRFYQQGHLHNKDGAAIQTYHQNGRLSSESHYQNGQLHNESGPAYTSWYENGHYESQNYYLNGQRHRDGDAAVITYHNNGQTRRKAYYQNGQLHNETGPAVTQYHNNGQVQSEEYYHNGKLHNNTGPAVRIWNDSGSQTFESHYQQGRLHHDSGPAHIQWNDNGQKIREEYYKDGSLHNDFAPAVRLWQDNGQLKHESYYVDGQRHRSYSAGGIKTALPAEIDYHDNGKVAHESYYREDLLHRNRTEGAAVIHYDENGNVEREEYWEDGSRTP